MGKVFDLQFMVSTVPEIISYLPVTLKIAACSGIIALILGFGVAFVRYFNIRILSPLLILCPRHAGHGAAFGGLLRDSGFFA